MQAHRYINRNLGLDHKDTFKQLALLMFAKMYDEALRLPLVFQQRSISINSSNSGLVFSVYFSELFRPLRLVDINKKGSFFTFSGCSNRN